jgi:hypothetical protein
MAQYENFRMHNPYYYSKVQTRQGDRNYSFHIAFGARKILDLLVFVPVYGSLKDFRLNRFEKPPDRRLHRISSSNCSTTMKLLSAHFNLGDILVKFAKIDFLLKPCKIKLVLRA